MIALTTLLVTDTVGCNSQQVPRDGSELATLYMALRDHDHVRGGLPPAVIVDDQGKAIASWRLAVIAYIGATDTSWTLDEAWNSPTNAEIRSMRPGFFCASSQSVANGETNMLAIVGPGTAFDPVETASLGEVDIDVVLVVEAQDMGIHWMEPGDFKIDTMPQTIGERKGISGPDAEGFRVMFADGTVWLLSHKTPFRELKKFFTVDGATQNDRSKTLGKYLVRDLTRSGIVDASQSETSKLE